MAPICGALDGTKTSVDSRRFKGFGAECQKEMIQFNPNYAPMTHFSKQKCLQT